MKKEQLAELLGLLADTQRRDMPGNGTSPVTVQIGYTDSSNMVRDDGIVILDAPATVIYAVIDWARRQKTGESPSLVTASVVDWQSGPGLHSRTRGLLVR